MNLLVEKSLQSMKETQGFWRSSFNFVKKECPAVGRAAPAPVLGAGVEKSAGKSGHVAQMAQ